MKTSNYKGFELDWVEEKQVFAISLEGDHVSHVPTIEIGEKCIDFYHEASDVSFNLHRKRAEAARQAERDNAGPEPELATEGKPNVAWVKWYRAISGCGLREAYEAAVLRISQA